MNTFAYAYVNPLVYADPLGLDHQITIGGGGTIIAPGVGASISITGGVNVGDNGSVSLYLQGQLNGGVGGGAYVGAGAALTAAQGDAPTTEIATIPLGRYVEGDVGPVSGNITIGPCGKLSDASGNAPVPHLRGGVGGGASIFAGGSLIGTDFFCISVRGAYCVVAGVGDRPILMLA